MYNKTADQKGGSKLPKLSVVDRHNHENILQGLKKKESPPSSEAFEIEIVAMHKIGLLTLSDITSKGVEHLYGPRAES